MRVPDHYAALGIQSTADASDIRKAYKKRALQTHPDKGGDEEEFKRVGAAYAVLSDQDKRRDYDEMRTDGLREGERDQTDYQATGFNSAFDAPFFGQRWDPGEKFTVDDARAQFDRFFGTQSPFANLSTPAARKVTQISTIRRRDGSTRRPLIIHPFARRVDGVPTRYFTQAAWRAWHARGARGPRTSTSSSTKGINSTAGAATSTPGCRRTRRARGARGSPSRSGARRRA